MTRPIAMKQVLYGIVGSLLLIGGVIRVAARTAGANDTDKYYDVVILNGRVMDPESGLDTVRNIGIREGKIAAISDQILAGKRGIDARGLVVAPGFIDLHEHGHEP